MSLKTRVQLVVLVLLIAGIWGLAARVSAGLQTDLEKIVVDQLSATVGYVAADIDSNLKMRLDLLKEIGSTFPLRSPEESKRYLEQRHPSSSIFPYGLVAVDVKGAVMATYPQSASPISAPLMNWKNLRAMMEGGQPYTIDLIGSQTMREEFVAIAVPLRNTSGAVVGALVSWVSPLDINLFNFHDNPNIGKVVRVVVVSPKSRRIVSASDIDRIFQPVPPAGENPLLDRRLDQKFEGMGITKTSYGIDTLSVNRDSKIIDWVVIAGIKTDDAFAPIKSMRKRIYFAAVLLSIALATLLHAVLTRQLAPLKNAADAMRRMSEDAQPFAQPIPVEREDEVGQLVSNFNRLMSERNSLYEELQESELTLQKAQSIANVGSWRFEMPSKKLTWSEEAYKIFGVSTGAPLTWKVFLRAVLPEDRKILALAWHKAFAGEAADIEHRIAVAADGEFRWVRQKLEVMYDDGGRPQVAVGTVQDITQSKASKAYIEFLAFHDALTKLPNRRLGKDRMDLAMAYADRQGAKAAVLFIDLDKFKSINDSLGHLVGDLLLKGVANRLRECVRETETVCRQGGDEFLIILSPVPDADAIAAVVEKILKKMASPFVLEGHQLFTSLSIGVAVYPDDGRGFEELVKAADTAMYHAKEAGRNTYRFYAEQMNVDAKTHLDMRIGLRHALERGEFVLYYQPQIKIDDAKTIGVEALIRWNHPELGLVSADRIIPEAEDSGLIIPIGEWVLREACRQAAAWQQCGLTGIQVSVNLSALQFKRGDLERTVTQALSESGLDPTYLELELTESILIQNSEHAVTTLRQLKALGIKLSIDDFGTGYSSLAYLKRFSVDKLKIDQSFIRGLSEDAEDETIVRAIIQMAHSLNLQAIAEGVEQEDTLKVLSALECDAMQGAYFAMPMPSEKVVEYF